MTECLSCERLRIERDKYKLEAKMQRESAQYWAGLYFESERNQLTSAVSSVSVDGTAMREGTIQGGVSNG